MARLRGWRLACIAGPLALAAAAGAWCAWSGMVTGKAEARDVVMVISGDTNGWITPCGCASGQLGGLPRRASVVAAARGDAAAGRADVVCADVGGAPGGVSAYQRMKFEAILAGEAAMGVAAHNLGGPEAALGADYLRGLAARPGSPLVSANLRDADGRPIAPAVRVVEAGGRRIGFVGLLSPRFAAPGVRVEDPRQAALAAIASTAGRADAFIVLAYLPEDELAALAQGLPEADAVIGGPTGQNLSPRQVGPTLLTSATNKGKFLVQLRWAKTSAQAGRWSAEMVEVGPALKDDPAQARILAQFRDDLARRDFSADETGIVPPLPAGAPAEHRFEGTASCVQCHEADSTAWSHSGHARAWKTLVAQRAQADPYCQSCHTTGYAMPGGFQSMRQGTERTDVGCESCHGPSAPHVRDPRIRTPYVAHDQCSRCHDHENSPMFSLTPYWERIRHGGLRDGGERPATQPAARGATEARP